MNDSRVGRRTCWGLSQYRFLFLLFGWFNRIFFLQRIVFNFHWSVLLRSLMRSWKGCKGNSLYWSISNNFFENCKVQCWFYLEQEFRSKIVRFCRKQHFGWVSNSSWMEFIAITFSTTKSKSIFYPIIFPRWVRRLNKCFLNEVLIHLQGSSQLWVNLT